MTEFIAIPTGLQIINWLTTMFRSRIILLLNLLVYGMVGTFTFGGISGI